MGCSARSAGGKHANFEKIANLAGAIAWGASGKDLGAS